MLRRRYNYTLGEKLQGLLDDEIKQKESIFYLYFKNVKVDLENVLRIKTNNSTRRFGLKHDPVSKVKR